MKVLSKYFLTVSTTGELFEALKYLMEGDIGGCQILEENMNEWVDMQAVANEISMKTQKDVTTAVRSGYLCVVSDPKYLDI